MALNRRQFLVTLPTAAGVVACASNRDASRGAGYKEVIAGTNAAEGTILVCMPETTQTHDVWTGLSDDLGKHFRLVAVHADAASAPAAIAEGMRRHRPSGLILMNNPTVAAYRAFQRSSGQKSFPPAVIVMTSFLDGQQPNQVRAATGISYEVPLITVVTNLRKLIATPIETVGVVLRSAQSGFVSRQAVLARREQIRVLEERVGMNPNPSELKRALRRLKDHVDVLWILNDDHLLTPRLITEAWVPGLNERPWNPTIVGAAALVSPEHSFGTFAVLPDHTALGSQAASLMFDIADNGWSLPDDSSVQLPLSTTTTVDLVQVRERFLLREDALRQVDRVLE